MMKWIFVFAVIMSSVIMSGNEVKAQLVNASISNSSDVPIVVWSPANSVRGAKFATLQAGQATPLSENWTYATYLGDKYPEQRLKWYCSDFSTNYNLTFRIASYSVAQTPTSPAIPATYKFTYWTTVPFVLVPIIYEEDASPEWITSWSPAMYQSDLPANHTQSPTGGGGTPGGGPPTGP